MRGWSRDEEVLLLLLLLTAREYGGGLSVSSASGPADEAVVPLLKAPAPDEGDCWRCWRDAVPAGLAIAEQARACWAPSGIAGVGWRFALMSYSWELDGTVEAVPGFWKRDRKRPRSFILDEGCWRGRGVVFFPPAIHRRRYPDGHPWSSVFCF
jgi:hypothetical protein